MANPMYLVKGKKRNVLGFWPGQQCMMGISLTAGGNTQGGAGRTDRTTPFGYANYLLEVS